MATYERSGSGHTIGKDLDYTFTVDSFTLPSGQQFKRYKVTVPEGISRTNMGLRPISGQSSNPAWDTWNTNKALIGWSNGSTSNVKVHNGSGASKSFNVKIIFETENVPYTRVTAGNKIMAADRSQTGTSTTAGNVIKDSHFSAGTKAEASTFNSQVLGL